MPELQFSTLIAWARRAAGDMATNQNQVITSDGTAIVRIKATGSITITKVMVGVVILASSEYSADANVLVLTTLPARGTKVTIFFRQSRYADADVINFLIDAARGLAGSLKYGWVVDESAASVMDGPGLTQLHNENGDIRPEIEELIVLRAALTLFADKANQAADNAIKIKDGDTSIDTAATAGASEKALVRLGKQYKDAITKILVESFVGSAQPTDWLALFPAFAQPFARYWI